MGNQLLTMADHRGEQCYHCKSIEVWVCLVHHASHKGWLYPTSRS